MINPKSIVFSTTKLKMCNSMCIMYRTVGNQFVVEIIAAQKTSFAVEDSKRILMRKETSYFSSITCTYHHLPITVFPNKDLGIPNEPGEMDIWLLYFHFDIYTLKYKFKSWTCLKRRAGKLAPLKILWPGFTFTF